MVKIASGISSANWQSLDYIIIIKLPPLIKTWRYQIVGNSISQRSRVVFCAPIQVNDPV